MFEGGKPAPDFRLERSEGTVVSLESLRGRPVVLYFYPRNETSGCTRQACALRDEWARFEERGAAVLGVSPDDVASHARFKEHHGLPLTLLADPEHAVAERYGVWTEKRAYGKTSMGIKRSTFVIDREGNVARAFYGVKPDGHAELVLRALDEAAA